MSHATLLESSVGFTGGSRILEIRRGFTIFQLMTILEKANHSLIIIEHDPLLNEDSQEMVDYNHTSNETGF